MTDLDLSDMHITTPTRDVFRAFLGIRPHEEPNFVWPFTSNLTHIKRRDANKESDKDTYLSSINSIYADEVIVKQNHAPRKRKSHDTFEKVFGSSVHGYSFKNTGPNEDTSDIFCRTTTLGNPQGVRERDKERRKRMHELREPQAHKQDIIELILSKAQAVDPQKLEVVDDFMPPLGRDLSSK